jgi:ATP-dependent Clp protease ATP-binding subunit ClpC
MTSPELRRFDNFTRSARMAFMLADEEAQRLNHVNLGTGHLLLGMSRGVARPAFQETLGASLDVLRSDVGFLLPRGRWVPGQHGVEALTDKAKRTIVLAVDVAKEEKVHVLTVAHLASGLIRLGEGIGYEILINRCQKMGVDPLEVLIPRIREIEAQSPQ